MNHAANYPHYSEDCAVASETLGAFGFESVALFADGSLTGRLPNYVLNASPATRANVTSALKAVARYSREGDFCVVYVTDHGFVDSSSFPYMPSLALWNDKITNRDFFEALDSGHPRNIVLIFQQCHSGVFALPFASTYAFEMAGASQDGPSYFGPGAMVNPFTANLFSAISQGANLRQAVEHSRKQNEMPEFAWHFKPLLRRSIRFR